MSAAVGNARTVSTGGDRAFERVREYLGEADARRAAALAEPAVVVYDASAAIPDAALDAAARALAGTGAFARVAQRRLIVAGTRTALATARAPDDAANGVLDEIVRASEASRTHPAHLRLRDRTLDLGARAQVVGILNVTPDSFYDRGRYAALDAARARAAEMVAQGADAIDIGGQSYASRTSQIAAEEEAARVVPVVRALLRDGVTVPLSIDTFKSSVAEAALVAGAHLINDCSGLSDPRLAAVVARYDAGLVAMHIKGRLNVRDAHYAYDDALAEICAFLRERTDAALAAGVARESLVVDPGLEFGKEPKTDLEILERFGDLRSLGYPILFAASRKSFIGRVVGRPARDLLLPSLATAAVGIAAGAGLVRVHDVAETAAFVGMLAAVRGDNRRALTIAAAMPA